MIRILLADDHGVIRFGLRALLDDKIATVDARAICTFPVGPGPDGEPVNVRVGKFGPYLEHGARKATLPEGLAPDELKLDQALVLLEQSQASEEPLGLCPATGRAVYIKAGRFGPYVTDGETNATLPRGTDPAEVTFDEALAHLDDLTVRWPADLCAVKWGQYHAFNLGDQGALLRFGERARIAHEDTPYAQGMIAFALEQNHRLPEAEEAGMRAVEIALDDAWAQHAIAHVYETQRRPQDGVRWLDHCAHTWERKGVFIRDHNWWHAALFRLRLGRNDEALAVYDERLWGSWPEFPQEQIGAASMLWRLELRGVDVGARWKPIVEQVRRRLDEHLFAFHDIHYLMALARGGESHEAEAFLRSMAASPRAAAEEYAWSAAALPAAEGVLHFARERYEDASRSLVRATPHLGLIGGSHAQRHVFIETLEAAAPTTKAAARQR